MKNARLRLLSYIVIAYMLMAFAWWSILLFTKNQDAFEAKQELVDLLIASEAQFNGQNTAVYKVLIAERAALEDKYRMQEWMILGEALVFIVILIAGVYLIDRGYRKEVQIARQRRNFLLSITHELKSPIASIQLILETFLKRDLNRPAIAKFSANALKETKRLYTLVNDLLLSAKLEEAYQLNAEEIDVSFLLNDLVTELEEKYTNAKFELSETTDIPNISGDLSGLTSVFLNLLENAIKYSKESANIKIDLHTESENICVKIADQGIGIPDREKKMVFQKFYRIGSEDTRSTKGTGLGLYIVQQIVKAHQGNIKILDNQPQGTIMQIQLPLNLRHEKVSTAFRKPVPA
ncbi:MAG: HAMP domain-containing sensor histidine kinase [Bacteroidota bacterium]